MWSLLGLKTRASRPELLALCPSSLLLPPSAGHRRRWPRGGCLGKTCGARGVPCAHRGSTGNASCDAAGRIRIQFIPPKRPTSCSPCLFSTVMQLTRQTSGWSKTEAIFFGGVLHSWESRTLLLTVIIIAQMVCCTFSSRSLDTHEASLVHG